jgi:hypothetical protein
MRDNTAQLSTYVGCSGFASLVICTLSEKTQKHSTERVKLHEANFFLGKLVIAHPGHGILRLSYDPMVHFNAHKIPSIDPTLSP